MKWLLPAVAALSLALFPTVAFAADEDVDDILIRINGDVTVNEGETVGTVIVINGNANIQGTVVDAVVVIHGTAIIEGSVGEDVTVIDGTADIRSGAQVQNINAVQGTIQQDPGATVTGEVNEEAEVNFDFDFGGIAAVFSILFWVAMTIVLVVSGLVFAAIGGRQLTDAARAMTAEFAGTVVGGVALWIALPILAGLLLLTIVAIPLSLGVFIIVLPTLWFLGYIVAGARLGGALVGLREKGVGAHPYAATVLGIVLLQLVTLIPFIGWLVAAIAGFWGAGALALIAFQAARGRRTPTEPTAVAV